MQKNVGTIDKLLRLTIGTGVIITGIAFKNFFGIIGVFPLVTAIIGHSPFYSLLRITTAHTEN